MKFIPSLDPHFAPMSLVLDEYVRRTSSLSHHTLYVTVERNDGYNYAFTLPVSDSAEDLPEAKRMAERMVKSVLWVVGGFKVYVAGDKDIFDHIHSAYSPSGTREFDYHFMQRVYEKPFEVLYVEVDQLPPEKKCTMAIGGHLDGCRIGFDAGGSDRKVSAVIDGEVVYSEEVVWSPKLMSDPNYHYGEILTAMKTAASKMPRVDAIGVSSAGVYVNNRIMVASLFVKVSDEDFERQVKTMYIDVAREMGEDIPLEVANDGDVTALAGAQELGCGKVLGVAMGTSEAVGYINAEGGLNGWLSELAFVPVDYNLDAMRDEWSGDIGCGVKYFSQDGVIKLAEAGGHRFAEGLSPAEKLKEVQQMMKDGNPLAREIYENIGIYLGYALPFYAKFYEIDHVLILGRVTSGEGGDIIMSTARRVLSEEFPALSISLSTPDETNRRVGQSIAAASLAPSKRS